ncbi:MAG: tetratricopeptide repeat protein [Bacteroidales bacterium]|nr:tetratricopeptide repeat protein [Bacteroidales bacterium]
MSIFAIVLFFSQLILAQDYMRIDSLKKQHQILENDSLKIYNYIHIGDEFGSYNIDSSRFYYEKALKEALAVSDSFLISESYHYIGFSYYFAFDYPNTIKFWEKSFKIDSLTKDTAGVSRNYGNIGLIYMEMTEYNKALSFFNKAAKINKQIDHKKFLAINYGNIALCYSYQSDYIQSLIYYQKAVDIYETTQDSLGLALVLGNIGNIYDDQNEYDKALEYFQISLNIYKKYKDDDGIARNLSNVGLVYHNKKQYELALKYYKEALEINKMLHNLRHEATNLSNIGLVQSEWGNTIEALKYYEEAYEKYKLADSYEGMESVLINISNILNKQMQYKKAIKYAKNALELNTKTLNNLWKRNAYQSLSTSYKGLKEFEKALEYKDLYLQVNDSLYNNEKTKTLGELREKYETEQKEKQILIQKSQLAKNKLALAEEKAEKQNQRSQRNLFLLAFVMMLILATYVLFNLRQKKKANHLLSAQKAQIFEQNEELSMQNEEILAQKDEIESQRDEIEAQRDIVVLQKEILEKTHLEISQSIDYAKRIQQSILPEPSLLAEHLSDHFVYFRPKDKVSGDYYWWSHIENHTIIAVADCTGHGVPGAFMSMLGTSFLREIVQKEYITHTGVILRKLRKEVIKSLKQNTESGSQKDGMDMAIISINHANNIVQYSGANNPLYIIKNSELNVLNEKINNVVKQMDSLELKKQTTKLFYEIKPDKMPIAIYDKMDSFRTIEFKVEKGDQLYLFSDGFADQFGGPNEKKFKYKPFKQLLFSISDKPLIEQKNILNLSFEEWKTQQEQVDDVVVMGIKI